MGFKADTEQIREFGATVTDLSTDAEQARQYADTWLGIGYGTARMFATVVEQATAVREILVDNYRKLETLASTSGQELAAAADHYDETDFAELERMDRLYPAPGDSTTG